MSRIKYDVATGISRARKRAGLSQARLAERIGVMSVTISRAEAGKSFPRLDVLLMISEALGVDLNTLCLFEITEDDDGQA